MPPHPFKSNFQLEETSVPSNNLWVGNLSHDVTDADLAALFNKHGALDIVKKNLLRSYAFVYFGCVENAKAAREALQGTVLRGSALKIEFVKPAKQCKSLWVGGICPSVTKEELEEQFLRFGKMQEFKFLRDRNTAFVDYLRIEDATEALKNLNGLRVGGDQIRVDYLRSHPTRREQLPDFRDSREGQFLNRSIGIPDSPWISQDFLRNYSDPAHYGPKRPQHFQSSGDPNVNGQPSNVLRVSYPPSSLMDEQMLHNAMILFGEIERIRSDPTRNSLFVEFRSVEEARRAKEGLEGRLFNDPRILIMYSNSELEPCKDQSGFYSGIKGPNMFLNDIPFQPGQMDIFSLNHLVPNSFPEHPLLRGVSGPDMLRKPLGPQGSFEPLLQGPEFSDLAKLNKLHDSNPNILMGGPNRKRLSPAPGVLSSTSPAMKPTNRTVSGSWDVFDASQLHRESKRSRTGSLLAIIDPSLEKLDVRGSGFNQYHGHGPQVDGVISGAPTNVQGMNRFSPLDERAVSGGTGQGHPELDYIWRGVIAKGGTHVCRARCVLVEKEFGFEIPEVVNCSARTGLDMLTKHLGDAAGFNIIYFLPNSVEDFAPYTEFLRYLGAKNRAGVAKFDDGTTLFLVPPSDFLTKVLNISGPERLYGVVLKFPQHVPGTTSELPQLAQQHYIDRPMMPSRTENIVMPQDERILQTDYNRVLHKNVNPPSKSQDPSISNSFSEHAVQRISTAATSQAGITLTPELIATLASLLPTKLNSSGAQIESGSSKLRPMLPPAATGVYSQEWNHEQSKVPEQSGHRLSQAVHQDNSQSQFPSQLHYSVVSNTHCDSPRGVPGNAQIDGSTFNMIQHPGNPLTRTTNFATPSQSEHFAVSPHVNQQYQLETPQDTQHGYEQGTNALGLYTASLLQPTTISATSSNQVYGTTVSQRHNGIPLAGENIGLEPRNQVQQLHSTHSGPGQGTSEVEVDKKERYQSTLQFAANLLLQIQQQQHHHPGAGAAQGSGNH